MWPALLLMTLLNSSSSAPAREPRVLRPKTEAQRLALTCREREVCYSGRKWGGKTWVDWTAVIDYTCTFPGSRGLVCREERASMNQTTLPVLWEIVPADWRPLWKKAESMLRLPNGSEIHVDGLDKPSRIQGSRYGIAACDQAEDLDFEQFTILNASVGQSETLYGAPLPYRKLLLAFNPSHVEHWAYKRYQPDLGDGVRTVDEHGRPINARVIHVQPQDLMDTIAPDYRETLEGMQGVFRNRLWLGLWCSAEGNVYDTWDPAIHLSQRPAEWAEWAGYPPPEWPRYFGIDFGYEPDPFAAGWIAEGPRTCPTCGETVMTHHLYRQLMHARRTIAQQAEQIVALEREELEALRKACPESRARELAPYLDELNIAGRWSDHHRGERAMLDEHGIHTQPADKDILAGIQTMLGRIKPMKSCHSSFVVIAGSLHERDRRLQEQGRPGSFEEEAGGYRWKTQREGSLGGLSRQLPVQINDHGLDWVRYVEHSLATRAPVGMWT